MKRAIAAAALVLIANGVVLISEARQHATPASLVALDICPAQLVGGDGTDAPPAIHLFLGEDTTSLARGLDSAGLRALGFSTATIAALGGTRDSTFRWPRPRPAWVRLRQTGDSQGSLVVSEVAPLRTRLIADSASLLLHGLIGVRERFSEPPKADSGAHNHAAMRQELSHGMLYPAVIEVIPSRLHLDRDQIARLRTGLADSGGCGTRRRIQVANGSAGGIWVASVP